MNCATSSRGKELYIDTVGLYTELYVAHGTKYQFERTDAGFICFGRPVRGAVAPALSRVASAVGHAEQRRSAREGAAGRQSSRKSADATREC